MPYKVLKDGATILKEEGMRTSLSKTSDESFPKRKSIVYHKDDIVQDKDIAPHVIKDYDDDVGGIRDLIEKIADGKSRSSKKTSGTTKTSKKSSGQKKK